MYTSLLSVSFWFVPSLYRLKRRYPNEYDNKQLFLLTYNKKSYSFVIINSKNLSLFTLGLRSDYHSVSFILDDVPI